MKNSMSELSLATLFSLYASISALFNLLQQAYNQFVPQIVKDYITGQLEHWFRNSRHLGSSFVLVIEQANRRDGYRCDNQVYEACEKYLSTKLSNTSRRLKVSRQREEDKLDYTLAKGEQFKETFQGVEFEWSYYIVSSNRDEDEGEGEEKESFELSVKEEHKEKVLKSYLPYVLNFYKKIRENEKPLKLNTLRYCEWHDVDFKHPFTFESLAMDPEVKKSIIEDLDRFVERREFYKKVGKAWKRGYLLYGPPGTGKSSLIAAIANYLKFDIYDLQLSKVKDDASLRDLMLVMDNKSILVLEDIDCSFGLPTSRDQIDDATLGNDVNPTNNAMTGSQISLSGLLNFLDGLWSSCGDERIIIFTTNYKAKLDPALLRPGRMDMHIHMSYLTMPGFRVLASNYMDLGTDEQHPLLGEIESLIRSVNVTAAQVAEEMMRGDGIDATLRRVISLLQKKKSERKESGITEDVFDKMNDTSHI